MRSRLLLLGMLFGLTGVLRAQPVPCGDVAELNTVYFGFTADTLDVYARARLDENLTILQPCAPVYVVVDGYTDGDEANRLTLSTRRVQAVLGYYLDAGLATERFVARGRGEHPHTFSEADPGPGDRAARRVESIPLEPGAFRAVPASAPPVDPPPYAERLVDGFRLTVDWAPVADPARADCPRTDPALGYRLQTAVLDRYDVQYDLDTACLYTDDPMGTLYARQIAQVRPEVYVVEGYLAAGVTDRPVAWILGPDGQRRTEAPFCAAYTEEERALDAALLRLASGRAAQDVQGEERDVAAIGEAVDRLRPFLDTVRAVGGTVDGLRLDCDALENPPHVH